MTDLVFQLLSDVLGPFGETTSKGTTVFRCLQPDYGIAIEDSILTGEPHVAVTLDPAGGYPFWTVARSELLLILLHPSRM